jgi:hypothetical protein
MGAENVEIWLKQATADKNSDLYLLCLVILVFGALFLKSILTA